MVASTRLRRVVWWLAALARRALLHSVARLTYGEGQRDWCTISDISTDLQMKIKAARQLVSLAERSNQLRSTCWGGNDAKRIYLTNEGAKIVKDYTR